MKTWPALEISGIDSDFLLADLDDFSPTAVEESGGLTRIFFSSAESRDQAFSRLSATHISVSAVDVPDEDWARRSQENLTPIIVGRIVVAPPWNVPSPTAGQLPPVVIQPSMGFGTGHHATTRLCLAALQSIDLNGAEVLDIGTGSGVLAIAARALGARGARGIDNDPDAIQSAQENLELNPGITSVTFALADLSAGIGNAVADVVTANLTGALLARAAGVLAGAARPGGTIVVSGLMAHERAAVEAAFTHVELIKAWQEDEWAALAFRR
ncbi:MAG TPA: 50S ribosomal protein L11 methyltransferase [Vicinamibacterales bacterium]|jgi:ribosomal protein L11 methyltransferase|nr:50S ribosomal protein L11 methyltransferase [Vicinamibacterales bacterium]